MVRFILVRASTIARGLRQRELVAAAPSDAPACTTGRDGGPRYGRLFDWQFTPVQGTDQAAEIVARGTAIGTLRVADGKISTFNGVVYVQVADIQASCRKAEELGGTVVPGFPFNLPDGIGAIAVVVDPAGHPLGLYSRTPLAPTPSPAK